MKIHIDWDEWSTVYDVCKPGEDGPVEIDAPDATVRRWKRAMSAFMRVQREMSEAVSIILRREK